ncbi:MAG: alkaline phosphatase family protein [Thermodesulfobacteriota bacterium]
MAMKIFSYMLFALILFLIPAKAFCYQTKNVFVVVIDGLRYSEAFGDSTYNNIPNMGNILKPQGTLYTNFYNLGQTVTLPGHISIFTGKNQVVPNVKDNFIRPIVPSFFEYYRKEKNIPETKTAVVIGGKITFLRYLDHSFFPGYGLAYKASLFAPGDKDQLVYDQLANVMDTNHPSLVFANFGNVDYAGHQGDWDTYLLKIQKADDLVYQLWQKIQSDPFYKDQTTLLVTTDHGRHDAQHGGFHDHGGICEGDKQVFLLAIGPDIKKNAVVATRGRLIDIAPTVGEFLGFSTPFADGRVLSSMFVNPLTPPIGPEAKNPKIVPSLLNLHLVWEDDGLGGGRILYKRSTDAGLTWSGSVQLTKDNFGATSQAFAGHGNHLYLGWKDYRNNNWSIFLKKSDDDGITWSADRPTALPVVETTRQDIVMDNPGKPHLVAKSQKLFLARRGRMLPGDMLGKTKIHSISTMKLRVNSVGESDAYTYLVQSLTFLPIGKDIQIFANMFNNGSWRIFKATSHDRGRTWDIPVPVSSLSGYAYNPQAVVDQNGIHLFWTDYRNGYPQIFYTRSTDGINFTPERIIVDNGIGSSNPSVLSSGGELFLAWENYGSGNSDIQGMKSVDGGVTWSVPKTLVQDISYSLSPDMAILNNELKLTWQSNRSGAWVIYTGSFTKDFQLAGMLIPVSLP